MRRNRSIETIYALASARGRAGVAVLRVSGPGAEGAIRSLSGKEPGIPRRAMLRFLRDPVSGIPIDRSLVLWFQAPDSFTGEDVAEFHIHGGRAVIDGMLKALSHLPGLRVAEAGEFTRRAFEQGKFDLTAAEGLADLVDAETDAQRVQALRQMQGALGALYEDWRGRLMHLLAYAEAEIDFAEEELPIDLMLGLLPELGSLQTEIAGHLNDSGRGERLREGIEVAIIGPPNVGKSSLLNRFAGREAAIVSEEAGTTRDVLEVRLNLAGLPVILVDTAGLHEASGKIEREGVRRALVKAEAADIRIVVAALAPDGSQIGDFRLAREGDLRLLNKIDLGGGELEAGIIGVSVLSGRGIDSLLVTLTQQLQSFGEGEHPLITRARHREGLCDCLELLARAQIGLKTRRSLELIAEDLRLAARALGRITGRVEVEDLLDIVFRDFCIGK